jgi:Xaa-Pro aminopeptidase
VPAAPDSRAERLAELAVEQGLEALIVGDLVRPGDSGREAMADLTWLTGFDGTSGLALVGPGVRLFVTDFRYLERARRALPDGFELLRAERQLVGALAPRLSGRVGFDPTTTSVRERGRLGDLAPEGVEMVEVEGLLADLRRVKDEAEVAAIAAACELADAVLAELEGAGLAGRTEREVALWIERRMRELGASAPAFPPIVAGGANGSLPHAEPTDAEIGPGQLVVVDAGAVLDGYCSDGTRTYATGPIGDEERAAYEVVLASQEAALAAVQAGAAGRAVDSVARDLIEEAGYGERFGHGLGHGVGIAVHEPPRLSQRSEDVLVAGDVVTVEPGVYLPGRFGIRIEDLVVVREGGARNLSARPKALLDVG